MKMNWEQNPVWQHWKSLKKSDITLLLVLLAWSQLVSSAAESAESVM